MEFSPLRASSRQSGGGGSRRSNDSRLAASDLMGASELFISWPSTRTRRCHARRSSSRSVRLRSVSTSKSCGKPCSRKVLRLTPHRPDPPGKASVSGSSSSAPKQAASPSSLAFLPSNLSMGWPSKVSPARFTRRRHRSGSKVKIATSISPMMVRKRAVASKAPRR